MGSIFHSDCLYHVYPHLNFKDSTADELTYTQLFINQENGRNPQLTEFLKDQGGNLGTQYTHMEYNSNEMDFSKTKT